MMVELSNSIFLQKLNQPSFSYFNRLLMYHIKNIYILFLIGFLFTANGLQAQNRTTFLIFNGKDLVQESNGDSLFLGAIQQGTQGNYSIRIQNQSQEPLLLSNVRGSCGLSVPSWPGNPIEPGQEATIQIRYDTSRLGSVNRNLTIHSNAWNSRFILKVFGEVIPRI